MSFFDDDSVAPVTTINDTLSEIRHRVSSFKISILVLNFIANFLTVLDCYWLVSRGPAAGPNYCFGVSARVRRRGGPARSVGQPSPSLVPDAGKNGFC
jgi:hypothetical protein